MKTDGKDDRATFEWWIHTERDNEAERRGRGREDMERTIEHLRRRGDARVVVHMSEGGTFMVKEIRLTSA